MVYKPGPDNKVVNALSHVLEDGELRNIFSFPIWLQGQQVQGEQQLDPFLKRVVDNIQQDVNPKQGSVGSRAYCCIRDD